METSSGGIKFTWNGEKVRDEWQKKAFAGVKAGCRVVTEEVRKNVSLPGGYSGHPYSRTNPTGFMNAEYKFQVHKPKSGLQVRKPSFLVERERVSGVAGLENTKVARMVVYGTSKMIPRDVVHQSASLALPEIRNAVMGAFKGGGGGSAADYYE